MLKKVLTASVFAALSTLGTLAAQAATPDNVNNNAEPAVPTEVSASPNSGPFYAGLQLGFTGRSKITSNRINFSNDAGQSGTLPNGDMRLSGSLAGRILIGYQMLPNLAFELGYLSFQSKNFDTFLGNSNVVSASQWAVDLAAKASLPILQDARHPTDLYGKLGLAYVTTDITGGGPILGSDTSPIKIDNAAFNVRRRSIAPEIGLGVSHDFMTNNLPIDISWTHIQPVGKNHPGPIDFVAVGVGYRFG